MNPNNYEPEGTELAKELDIPVPKTTSHGTEEDIRSKLTPIKVHNWRQEGNRIIGQTEWGELSQTIPMNKLLVGTDEKGLPIFKSLDR